MLDMLQSIRELKARPPDVPFGVVPRPRLSERLTTGTAGPVTLVCAGPGASKTLTVAAWVKSEDAPWPVGWLSLDASDNSVHSFWSSVLFTLSECGGLPDDSGLREITPAAGFGPEQLLEVRARLVELPLPIVLVLDDFQEITDDDTLTSFGELVDHLPASLRLVLISRSDPTLRLHRLRASGQLTEIRTSQLAFNDDETATLFASAGIPLRSDQVALIRERTEGWPVGVRLAALSIDRENIDASIRRLSGTDGAIADYLVGEVMRRLSPEHRDFLLRTSIVERISGPLADEITGRSDSQSLLENFAKANAFVMGIGDGGGWFTYHRMLRDLLSLRLALEQPDAERQANRAAAEWFSLNDDHIVAIRHWLLAGERDAAGRILLRIIPKVLSPEGPELAAVVAPLAAEATDDPCLTTLLAAAMCHFRQWEIPEMERDARAAHQFLDEAGESRASAEGVLMLFEVAAARFSADSAAVARITAQVIDLVDRTPRRTLPAGPAFRVIALINQAGAQLWNGLDDDTAAVLKNAAEQAARLDLVLPQLNAIGHLALVDAFGGRCAAAENYTTQATEIIDRRGWGSEPQALATYLAQALVELARQRPTEAAHHVRRGLAASAGHTDRSLRLALGIAWVEVMVGRQDASGALAADSRMVDGLRRTPCASAYLRRWSAVAGAEALLLAGRPEQAVTRLAAEIGDPADQDGIGAIARDSTLTARERVCLSRAALALGDDAVLAILEPVLTSPASDKEAVIGAHLLHAVLATRGHRDAAALAALGTALELAHTENIRRPFVSIGDRVDSLLNRYRHLDGTYSSFAGEILTLLRPVSASAPTTAVTGNLTERLTEREAIVLRYLPTMLKAGEIADDLFVSVNTVKAHLRAIYRKLGVANRREAVEKARVAGLL